MPSPYQGQVRGQYTQQQRTGTANQTPGDVPWWGTSQSSEGILLIIEWSVFTVLLLLLACKPREAEGMAPLSFDICISFTSFWKAAKKWWPGMRGVGWQPCRWGSDPLVDNHWIRWWMGGRKGMEKAIPVWLCTGSRSTGEDASCFLRRKLLAVALWESWCKINKSAGRCEPGCWFSQGENLQGIGSAPDFFEDTQISEELGSLRLGIQRLSHGI